MLHKAGQRDILSKVETTAEARTAMFQDSAVKMKFTNGKAELRTMLDAINIFRFATRRLWVLMALPIHRRNERPWTVFVLESSRCASTEKKPGGLLITRARQLACLIALRSCVNLTF